METEHAIAERTPAASDGRIDNPYVGPRPLQTSDTIYGRARELHELGDLLIAERIVLLHSPSGAGKTSLVNAGLVKRFREQERFRVLPPLRVNLADTRRVQDHPNRYVRSVAECLLADLTDEQCKTLVASAMPCLSDYLRQRPRRAEDGPIDSRFELLIFDQFEEICTLDPTDTQAKEAFFAELGEALRDRNRWALFVIREDHLAEVDAFSHLLPTAFATRFRLNLLTVDQARQAIEEPAKAAGRPFCPERVRQLADDLAMVTVLSPAGPVEAVGRSVEPVQLQVVCRRLWQSHGDGAPAAAQSIGTGAVDDALADFYDEVLERVAHEQAEESPRDRERRIRNWLERQLIVKPGIRNLIMRGYQSTEELPDDCIGALVSEHLLRADRRGGRDWIEITHDRMIAPIIASNERWRKRHLQLYQLRADLWNRNNRSADMLLSQGDYETALRWQNEHPGKPGDVEKAFLDASGAALAQRAALAENERRMRLLRRASVSFLILVILMLGCGGTFLWYMGQRARIEKLNGEALLPQGQYKVTLEKAVEAYDVWRMINSRIARGVKSLLHWGRHPTADALLRDIRAAMLAGLVSVPPVQMYPGSRGKSEAAAGGNMAPECSASGPAAVRQIAFDPARKLLAAACADGTVALWNLDHPDQRLDRLKAGEQAWSVAFNADGTLLAVGSNDGVRVWRIDRDWAGAGTPARSVLPLRARAMAVAFNDDNLLAVAQDSGDVSVRDAERQDLPSRAEFRNAGKGVGVLTSITFMRNGKLAFAGWSGNIWVWPWRKKGGGSVAPGKTAVLNFFADGPVYLDRQRHRSGIADLAYHAETDQLAAAGWLGKKADGSNADGHSHIAVWSHASTAPRLADREGREGRELVSHALAFSPDGRTLAYSGGESRVLSFMASPALPSAGGPAPAAPVRFQERLFSVAFSPYPSDHGNWVAVGDGERIAMLDLQRSGPVAARALPLKEPFDAHAGQYHAAMADDGSVVAVAAGTKLAVSRQVGRIGDYAEVRPVPTGMGELSALAIAPHGELIAAAGFGADPVMLFDRRGQGKGQIRLDQLCQGAGTSPSGMQMVFRPHDDAVRLAIASGKSLCVVGLGNPADIRAAAPFRDTAEADIRALAYSDDGTRLAALEGDNIIRVHEAGGGSNKFTAPVTRVTTLTFTPDRRYLAFGTNDADIWILDLQTGRRKRLDQLHDTGIKSIRFGGDAGDKFMVSADIDGRIMMWRRAGDSASIGYNRLGRLLPTKGSHISMALSDNGELLLVGGDTPRVFDLRMSTLLALACKNVERDKHPTCRDVPP
jgi:WD40 repeat protein